jgi:hypothetical protein
MIPKVVASEMGKAQTELASQVGVVGPGRMESKNGELVERCGKAYQRG